MGGCRFRKHLEKGLPSVINLTTGEWVHRQTLDYEQISFKCCLCHEYHHFAKCCLCHEYDQFAR